MTYTRGTRNRLTTMCLVLFALLVFSVSASTYPSTSDTMAPPDFESVLTLLDSPLTPFEQSIVTAGTPILNPERTIGVKSETIVDNGVNLSGFDLFDICMCRVESLSLAREYNLRT